MATEYKLPYTGSEISQKLAKIDSLAEKSEVPTKTSDLNNDSGFITEYTETDPTVPSWAKAATKPTYTASEVGALPDTTVIPTVPTNVSDFNNDAGYLTTIPNEYITETELTAKGYLTEHQSLAGYAKTADLGTLSTKDTVAKTDLASDVQTSLGKADTALQSYTETDPTVPSWAKASTKPSYTASEVGLGNVDNVKQYSASNPPPYPVTSVNGKTGAITLSASDVGADASGTASSAVSAHNTNTYAHSDIREQISQLSDDIADQKTALETEVSDRENAIIDLKAQGVQQIPLFAESVEWLDENGDESKVYVLPDGYIYGHMNSTEEIETTVTVPAKAAVIDGKRYSHSSQAFVDNAGGSCIVVPIDYSAGAFEIAVTGITLTTSTYMGTTNTAFPGNVSSTLASNTITITDSTVLNNIAYNQYRFVILRCTSPYASGATLTYNGEEIELVKADDSTVAEHSTTTTTTETIITEGFVNTGHAFVSGDNEAFVRVNSVEEMTDENKVYLLDGCIYQYGKRMTTVISPGETTVAVPAKAALLANTRYSLSGSSFVDGSANGLDCIVIPFDTSVGGVRTITFTGMTRPATYQPVYAGTTNSKFTTELTQTTSTDYTYTTIDCSSLSEVYNFIVLNVNSLNGSYDGISLAIDGVECDVVVTTDSTIASPPTTTTTDGITETVEVWGFYSECADNKERIDELEEKIENDVGNTESVSMDDLSNFLNSVQCPEQLPANGDEGSDFNLHTFADFGTGFHSYFDDLVARYPHYLVREYLGKDESETIDMYRYVLGKHYYSAWCEENHPRMYAWKNGDTVIYSVSVAPRIGDTMYSTTYVGATYSTVTAVSATNRSRTVNDIEFVRYNDGDIEPTVCYTPAYNPYNRLVNASGALVAGISTIDGDVLTDANSKTYKRYPFGDLKKDGTQPIHMTIIANEHGGDTEPGIPAVVTARLIRDLCNGKISSDNPVYRYLRDNVQLTIIPVVNPHGLNRFPADEWDGYHNANNVNINRNYDTPGWDVYWNENPDEQYRMGDYPGSENETQYVMNTMADSKAVVAMSVHTISCLVTGYKSRCMYQGQNPNGGYTQTKIEEIADDMKASYNLDFVAYDPLECSPETTSKSPSFITQCGAYGGIVEFQCHDPLATEDDISTDASMFTDTVMEQNYSLLLKFIAMWLSDYLDNN